MPSMNISQILRSDTLNKSMKKELIAPCGMNCGICIGYFGQTLSGKQRKNPCPGCILSGKSCAHIKKYCNKLLKNEVNFCYECHEFPCDRLQRLDESYRRRFDMSMIDNLMYIRDHGMDLFLSYQEKKYHCPMCQGVINVHTKTCIDCGSQKG